MRKEKREALLWGEDRDLWQAVELDMPGATADVRMSPAGIPHCTGRACRHMIIQRGLFDEAETWRCGLAPDLAPPVPPRDVCLPWALQGAEERDRLHRSGESA